MIDTPRKAALEWLIAQLSMAIETFADPAVAEELRNERNRLLLELATLQPAAPFSKP